MSSASGNFAAFLETLSPEERKEISDTVTGSKLTGIFAKWSPEKIAKFTEATGTNTPLVMEVLGSLPSKPAAAKDAPAQGQLSEEQLNFMLSFFKETSEKLNLWPEKVPGIDDNGQLMIACHNLKAYLAEKPSEEPPRKRRREYDYESSDVQSMLRDGSFNPSGRVKY